jgi:hypothetical protein
MKKFVVLLTLAAAAVSAADSGYRTEFVGGTLSGVPAKASAHLTLTAPDALLFECGGQTLNINYSKIDAIEYGQTVSRRYAAALLISPIFLFTKTRRHFVTIAYVDADGKHQALVIRVDKNDIRGFLTTLEARSGRRIEYQDDEARKTGK